MDRLKKLFASRSFAVLLFHLGLLFFVWPILSIPSESGEATIFYYIFAIWGVLVLMLFFVGASIHRTEHTKKDLDDA